MIKTDLIIPDIIDVDNPQQLFDFLTAVKLFVEDLARKGQQMQMEIRTTAPSKDDLEEGSFVRATVGGLHYLYTKKGGEILRWQLT